VVQFIDEQNQNAGAVAGPHRFPLTSGEHAAQPFLELTA